jgi:hypothetical protein
MTILRHLGRVLTMLVSPYIDAVVDFDVPQEYEDLMQLLDIHGMLLRCMVPNTATLAQTESIPAQQRSGTPRNQNDHR